MKNLTLPPLAWLEAFQRQASRPGVLLVSLDLKRDFTSDLGQTEQEDRAGLEREGHGCDALKADRALVSLRLFL